MDGTSVDAPPDALPPGEPATPVAVAPRGGLPLAVWAGGLSLMVLALLAWLLRG